MPTDDATPARTPLYAQQVQPGDRLKAALIGGFVGVVVIALSVWWSGRPTPESPERTEPQMLDRGMVRSR